MNWLILGVLAVVGLYSFGGDDGATDRPPWTGPIWVPRTEGDRRRILVELCKVAVGMPNASADELAAKVWAELQPGVPWPITKQDSTEAQQAAATVLSIARLYVAARENGTAQAYCEADKDPAPPPYDLDEWEDPYPTPGAHYQVVYGDIIGGSKDNGILYRALLSAGYLAATQVGGLDQEAASAWARTFAKSSQNRAVYRNLLHCGAYNDGYYATYGFGQQGLAGPLGRGFRLLQMHPDNRARLRLGQTPMRSIDVGKDGDQKTGSAKGSGPEFPFFWLPGLNLEAVWYGENADEKVVPALWSDGSSTVDPPPEIRSRIRWDILPKGSWGCPDTGNQVVVS